MNAEQPVENGQGADDKRNASGSLRQDLDAFGDQAVTDSLETIGVGLAPLEISPPLAIDAKGGVSTRTRLKVLRLHAKGGLGQVSIALDEELHREVAFKEIQDRVADSTVHRQMFIWEAEVTGRLEHPGIVPIYGLGQHADGRPFYAMRFIRGESLDEAITRFHAADQAKRDPGERSLALRELLGRFLDVCNAISYAHSRGVLHRDLKPANIMLGEYGETLVVDWGMSKSLDRDEDLPSGIDILVPFESGSASTAQGSVKGTPQYMSPEQAEGRINELGPATDVYALGATLYALLTGQPPFPKDDIGKILSAVKEGRCKKPRELKPNVPRALESICLRAMAVQPVNRYATAKAMADDVRHWLGDEPVSAHRESLGERITRLERRHRALVRTAGVALAVISLVAFVAALAIYQQHSAALTARNESDKSKARAERVLDILVKSFRRPDPSVDGRKVTVASVLDQAMEETKKLEGDPLEQAALLDAIGETYRGLGLYDESSDALRRTIRIRKDSEGEVAVDTLTSMNNLAVTYQYSGQFEKAVPLLESALRLIRIRLGTDHPDTLIPIVNLAGAYQGAGYFDKILPLLEPAIDRIRGQLGVNHPSTLVSMNNLGYAYLAMGQVDKAMATLEQATDSMRSALGPDHPITLSSTVNLALANRAAGHHEKALSLLEQSEQVRQTRLGSTHPDTLCADSSLGLLYLDAKQPERALPLLERVLPLMRNRMGIKHPDTLGAINNLAMTYSGLGQIDKAIPLLEQNAKLWQANLGPKHPNTLTSISNVASAYLDVGRVDKALQLNNYVYESRRMTLGDEHPDTLRTMNNLAWDFYKAGEVKKAQTLYEQALERLRRTRGDGDPLTLTCMLGLANVDFASYKSDDGVRLVESVVRIRRSHARVDDPRLPRQLVAIASTLLDGQQHLAAEVLLREIVGIGQNNSSLDWRDFSEQSMLGAALLGQKKYTEAEPLLIQGYEGMKQHEESTPRPLPKDLQSAAQWLVDFYTATNKPDERAKWQAELDRVDTKVEALKQLAGSFELPDDSSQAMPTVERQDENDTK